MILKKWGVNMIKKFCSTRNNNISVLPARAIVNGISDDGGLYVCSLSDFPNLEYADYLFKTYDEVALAIFSKVFTDFTKSELEEMINKAYSSFKSELVTPIVEVGDISVQELFHGPTSAFKDIALSLLPHLMSTSLVKNGISERVLILTATSGDTGTAALNGFMDVDNIDILVFYPNEGVSKIQKIQMVTQQGDNVGVCAINGNFDDAQNAVKSVFSDNDINTLMKQNNYLLSSANSINIGRLIPQVTYYFSAYSQLVANNQIVKGDLVDFVVPTGNFGNILAGYYAKNMGLPIRNLICASNENDVLDIFIKTGTYNINRSFKNTIAPSMDILISSNLERLLWHMYDENDLEIVKLMKNLKETGEFTVSSKVLEKIRLVFNSYAISEVEINETISNVFVKHKYVLDPHSAIAYAASLKIKNSIKTVVLATASPYKFCDDVYYALTSNYCSDQFQAIEELKNLTGMKVPENIMQLKSLEILHNECIDKEYIKDFVKETGGKLWLK